MIRTLEDFKVGDVIYDCPPGSFNYTKLYVLDKNVLGGLLIVSVSPDATGAKSAILVREALTELEALQRVIENRAEYAKKAARAEAAARAKLAAFLREHNCYADLSAGEE